MEQLNVSAGRPPCPQCGRPLVAAGSSGLRACMDCPSHDPGDDTPDPAGPAAALARGAGSGDTGPFAVAALAPRPFGGRGLAEYELPGLFDTDAGAEAAGRAAVALGRRLAARSPWEAQRDELLAVLLGPAGDDDLPGDARALVVRDLAAGTARLVTLLAPAPEPAAA